MDIQLRNGLLFTSVKLAGWPQAKPAAHPCNRGGEHRQGEGLRRSQLIGVAAAETLCDMRSVNCARTPPTGD